MNGPDAVGALTDPCGYSDLSVVDEDSQIHLQPHYNVAFRDACDQRRIACRQCIQTNRGLLSGLNLLSNWNEPPPNATYSNHQNDYEETYTPQVITATAASVFLSGLLAVMSRVLFAHF